MQCNLARTLIDADLDGELDLANHLQVAEHLGRCASCRTQAENAQARRAALRAGLPRFPAPDALRSRVAAALSEEGARERPAAPGVVWPAWRAAGLAATLTLCLVGAYEWGRIRSGDDRLLAETVADHVRSLQAGHLTDVVSTDQHTVKPWFTGRLDFSPPVADLSDAGFPLAGGRMDYLDGHPAAALVFHRRQHPINLLVWRAAPALPERSQERFGYRTVSWSDSGLNFVAISEIPAPELEAFAAAFRSRTR